jgi:HNH endonuclease
LSDQPRFLEVGPASYVQPTLFESRPPSANVRRSLQGNVNLRARLAWRYVRGSRDECWPWTGARTSAGYGHLYLPGRRHAYAHRLLYEIEVGPIPEGHQVDHLCRNHACVNPAHLEPVTSRENTRRGRAGTINRARFASQMVCKNGHYRTADNVRFDRLPGGSYRRSCRECERDQYRRRVARMRAVA